jgi:hypothetical protein
MACVRYLFSSCHIVFALSAMAGLLPACSESTKAPASATVCELSSHVQRLVQVDAEVSVDATGHTVIGDARCATLKFELQLSGAASRAGAAEQLRTASQQAASSGKSTIPVRLSGVFTQATTGAYFVADSISGLPAAR